MGICNKCVHAEVCTKAEHIENYHTKGGCLHFLDKDSATKVVRCGECSVPHNQWTGCPRIGGLVPTPTFYCAAGRKNDAEG